MATFTQISLTVAILVAFCSAAPNKNLSLKVPDECKGKGFCSIKPEGYDEMQKMVSELLPASFIGQSLGDRIGEDVNTVELSSESDWHNCPSRKTTKIFYAYSQSNDTDADYVIQLDNYKQHIEIVTCANDKIETGSQECFRDLGLGVFNLKFTCVSSSAKRNILVYDYKSHEIKSKPYDIPCCCSCQITSSI